MAERDAELAGELVGLLGSGRQVEPPARRFGAFGLEAAYAVSARVRRLRAERGETPVGRKLGFTNTAVWAGLGIDGPMWNWMYDATVRDLADGGGFDLAGIPEPRIEPEVVLHLARAPRAGMSEAELLACVDWVAPGFEIVQSPYPGWRFTGADAVAAFGLHAALLVGPRQSLAAAPEVAAALGRFTVVLERDGAPVAEGKAGDVLGGPVCALGFLVRELRGRPPEEALAAGELVTTGTLTPAPAVAAGAVWSARFDGIGLAGISLALTAGG